MRMRANTAVLMFAGLAALLIAGCRQSTGVAPVAITHIACDPKTPRLGDKVTFAADIRNNTKQTIPAGIPISVVFAIDGEVSETAQYTDIVLKPGQSKQVEAQITGDHPAWVATRGPHIVGAMVVLNRPDGTPAGVGGLWNGLLRISPPDGKSVIKIMPLGDSITNGNKTGTSYRYFLYKHLAAAGYHDIHFVGSIHTIQFGLPPRDTDWDMDHEGHSGWRSDEICSGHVDPANPFVGKLTGKLGWAKIYRPDIVILNLGCNDLEQGRTPQEAVKNVRTCISALRAANSDVAVALCELIPAWNREPGYDKYTVFNAFLLQMAVKDSTPRSPIEMVDLYSALNVNTDLIDGVHANDQGNEKMANRIYPHLMDLIHRREMQIDSRHKRHASLEPSSTSATSAIDEQEASEAGL